MEIIRQRQTDESAELLVRGRLDGAWADHLAAELDNLVREGLHRLWLDLSEVTYLSSLSLGVLLRFQTQLKGLGGSLKVVSPSEPVRAVLEVSRLVPLLVGAPPSRPGYRHTTWEQRAPRRGVIREGERVTLETFEYPTDGLLRCRTVGDPSLLRGCRFREVDCRPVALGAEAFAVGVGALGREYEDCRGRFGEFLAAAGVAAYLPTDGSNVPDYLTLGEATAPNVRLCYGLVFEGPFSRLTRFETRKEGGPVTLTELVTAGLDLAGADAVGLVLVAESAGLMGAALRRSPAGEAAAEAPFAHPAVRDWLTFTGERAYRSSTTLVVGVATRGDAGALAALVRPLGRGPRPAGHFHAAPFSHRTLPIGEIDLQATVAALFENQHLQGVLHLLSDYREPTGLGESEFVRGACWLAALDPVELERTFA
jgi:anti-anti-sigma factor